MRKRKDKKRNLYEIQHRETKETQFIWGESAQEVCDLLGWQIGDCFISEVKRSGNSKL